MKEAGTTHWDAPNTGATNESGFTALPGGYRYYPFGFYGAMGLKGDFWSASQFHSNYAWTRVLLYNSDVLIRVDKDKGFGLAVRLLRD